MTRSGRPEQKLFSKMTLARTLAETCRRAWFCLEEPRFDLGRIAGAVLATLLITALLTGHTFAHERWILTPQEIAEWNARPKPLVFTHFSFLNISMISLFLLFLFGWVHLGFTGARELFPDLQARLSSYGDNVPFILRFCLAWMLISSTFGAEPRHGVEPFTSPTLFAPDLELHLLGAEWQWLRWAQLTIGLAMLCGVYVRFFAFMTILLGLLAGWLFGSAILSYAGALIGVCVYLIMQGPGRRFIPLPTPSVFVPLQNWLAAQPRQRAQAIMRVLTGVTVLYLGVFFKVLHPNLLLGIVETYQLPVLSSAPEAFTLLMTLVEVSAGFLIIAGILLRPLSLVLLAAFLFFASLLPESYTSHILFYGVMLSFLFNAAGHWRMPVAQDKRAEIVIIGGGFSAIGAATRIEKLIGQYTNVRVTLVHSSSNMLFYPLLPEVVGGAMQPGNVVNPIRRIVPQTRVLRGVLDRIDDRAKEVVIERDGKNIVIPYDELILALFLEPNLDLALGIVSHAYPIDSIGDALHIRKRVLEQVEEAELEIDPGERERLLTFSVIGSGQRSCATAVELAEMLRTASVSYPVLQKGWRVHLYEDARGRFTIFERQILAKRNRELERAGIRLFQEERVTGVTGVSLTMASGARHPVGMTINAAFRPPSVLLDGERRNWPLAAKEDLSAEGHPTLWIAAPDPETARRHFTTTGDLVAMGEAAGYNAWARSQGYASRAYRRRRRFLVPFNMGRSSLCRVGGVVLRGGPAWMLSRVTNLWALPGLERNLRILMDWLLDIPFRNDIAVLAPDQTERLQRRHFEPGDEVIVQGEAGDMAYVVESGRLEVLTAR